LVLPGRCPVHKNLVGVSLLDGQEKKWLNDYHAETRRRCRLCYRIGLYEAFGAVEGGVVSSSRYIVACVR
jgi:hypothetical protein